METELTIKLIKKYPNCSKFQCFELNLKFNKQTTKIYLNNYRNRLSQFYSMKLKITLRTCK